MKYKYKGHIISIYPIVEPTEDRVARGDWRSKILGYRYEVRQCRGSGIKAEGGGFQSEDDADDEARERIQAWEDSL